MRQILVTFVALLLTAPPAALAQARQGGTRATPPPTPAPAPTTTVPPPITFPFGPLMNPPTGGLAPRAGEGVPFRHREAALLPFGLDRVRAMNLRIFGALPGREPSAIVLAASDRDCSASTSGRRGRRCSSTPTMWAPSTT